jgi:predicted phage-related endonuclease
MNSEIKAILRDAFRKTDLTIQIGDGWVNIARPDGVHCEFYPCYGRADLPEEYLTARYTLDGTETDIDLHIPNQINEFVDVCKQILSEAPASRFETEGA